MRQEMNQMLLATEMLMKWTAEHAEFSPYQRAQNRDVETMMFVHVSCVPDIDLKILQSQPTQGDHRSETLGRKWMRARC